MSAVVTPELQREIEQFLYAEARKLDDGRYRDWLALFTEDGHYWMPAEEDQEEGEGQPGRSSGPDPGLGVEPSSFQHLRHGTPPRTDKQIRGFCLLSLDEETNRYVRSQEFFGEQQQTPGTETGSPVRDFKMIIYTTS